MTDTRQLELQLGAARLRLLRASKPLGLKNKNGVLEEYRAASDEVLRLERLLATAKGEEYAETLNFPVGWNTGAPLPQLLVNDDHAMLVFLIDEPDPDWNGTYVTMKSPSNADPEPLGLVEFEHCVSAKLGAPNDEVFGGHPLHGRGMESYTVQRVVNSAWIKNIEAINSIHPYYRPDSWKDLNHYIFWFHDSTFECIAKSFKVEVYRTSMRELLSQMVERMIT
jgi:hypothetical protein